MRIPLSVSAIAVALAGQVVVPPRDVSRAATVGTASIAGRVTILAVNSLPTTRRQ